MISFRFHLVSITAVFLAIAIGVVMGSTFVDRAIVDGLEDRIDAVSSNLDERRAEIAELQEELQRLEDYVAGSEPFVVDGRLDRAPVAVVALRGVDEGSVRSLVELARQAGATAPGVLWVEPRWALDGDDDAADLATAIGEDADDPGDPDELRAAAWQAVAAALAAPPAAGEADGGAAAEQAGDAAAAGGTDGTGDGMPTTGPAGPAGDGTPTTDPAGQGQPGTGEPEVLAALVEAGFLAFDAVGEDGAEAEAFAGTGPLVALVTGPGVDEPLAGLGRGVVAAALDAGLRLVVAEHHDEGATGEDGEAPERGEAALAAVPERDVDDVSLVDHLDLPIGRVATVLALADLRRDVVGRYGVGDGARAPLPAWTAGTGG